MPFLTLALAAALAAPCPAQDPSPSGQSAASAAAPAAQSAPPCRARAQSWRDAATDADQAHLRDWRTAWTTALPRAQAAEPAAVREQGELFDFDRALDRAMPPAGSYRCTTFKLGANAPSSRDFGVFAPAPCRIDSDGTHGHFAFTGGLQRPTGTLYAETDSRGVFLGTLVLSDETRPLQHGVDAARDLAGYVERIAPQRWRLVIPSPYFEAQLEVIEIVPA